MHAFSFGGRFSPDSILDNLTVKMQEVKYRQNFAIAIYCTWIYFRQQKIRQRGSLKLQLFLLLLEMIPLLLK